MKLEGFYEVDGIEEIYHFGLEFMNLNWIGALKFGLDGSCMCWAKD